VKAGGAILCALLLAGCRFGKAPTPASRPTPASAAAVARALPAGVTREDYEYLLKRELRLPVADVPFSRLRDTFDDARDGKRVHRAVDIMAPKGTPVLSVDAGKILKLRKGGAGGITIYAVDAAEKFVYYYAHLDRYHRGLAEGQPVQKGDTIGYVGTTGNAPRNFPHLHFQVTRMPPDRKWWAGVALDPLPLFRRD
jgi:peptidoglycan LD-endopeptidase LytH